MKEKFKEWLNSNLKDNSPLLTKGQYDEIIKYLEADDKSAYPRRIQRRVASNSYQLWNNCRVQDALKAPIRKE